MTGWLKMENLMTMNNKKLVKQLGNLLLTEPDILENHHSFAPVLDIFSISPTLRTNCGSNNFIVVKYEKR